MLWQLSALLDGFLVYYSTTFVGVISQHYNFYRHRAPRPLFGLHAEDGKDFEKTNTKNNSQKKTPWPLVRERTIPTERPKTTHSEKKHGIKKKTFTPYRKLGMKENRLTS
jgi:hypothetical protein